MSTNKWARITESHYIHPDLGYIKSIGNQWEATPKLYFKESPQSFEKFEKAIKWMESLKNGRSF